jgi:hypothetical protein
MFPLQCFTILTYRDNHIALFVALFHVAMRLDDLLKGIDAVNGWFEMAGFEQVFEFQDFLEARLAQWGRTPFNWRTACLAAK